MHMYVKLLRQISGAGFISSDRPIPQAQLKLSNISELDKTCNIASPCLDLCQQQKLELSLSD